MSLNDDILIKFRHQRENIPEKWIISAPLRDKVSPESLYLPFYGYTSVFHLSAVEQKKCSVIQEKILQTSGNMLIPLPSSSFHITAHEFANEYTISKDSNRIDFENEKVLEKIGEMFHLLLVKYGNQRICLRALGPSTSGSDVVSIKFVPDNIMDEEILEEIFDSSESIWKVGRKYIPHVSLGYFRLNEFGRDDIIKLYNVLNSISENLDMKVCFSVSDLVYQRHFSMEDFRDLFSVADMDENWREKCLSSMIM